MKTTYTEKRPTIGGGYNTFHIEESDTWGDQQLGIELTDRHELRLVECDHYENEDEEGVEISPDRWVKKTLVRRVIWQTDSFGTRTLARIEFARPLNLK